MTTQMEDEISFCGKSDTNDYVIIDPEIVINVFLEMIPKKMIIFMPRAVTDAKFLNIGPTGTATIRFEEITDHILISNDIVSDRIKMIKLHSNISNTLSCIDNVLAVTKSYLQKIRTGNGTLSTIDINSVIVKSGIFFWENYNKMPILCTPEKKLFSPQLLLDMTMSRYNQSLQTTLKTVILLDDVKYEKDIISKSISKCIVNKNVEYFCINFNLAILTIKKVSLIIKGVLWPNNPLYAEMVAQKLNGEPLYKEVIDLLCVDMEFYLDTCIKIISEIMSQNEIDDMISSFGESDHARIVDKKFLTTFKIHIVNFFGQILYLIKILAKQKGRVDCSDPKIIHYIITIIWHIRYDIINNDEFNMAYKLAFRDNVCVSTLDAVIYTYISYLYYQKYFVQKGISGITTFCADSVFYLQKAETKAKNSSIINSSTDSKPSLFFKYIESTLVKLNSLDDIVYHQKKSTFLPHESAHAHHLKLFIPTQIMQFSEKRRTQFEKTIPMEQMAISTSTLKNKVEIESNHSNSINPNFLLELKDTMTKRLITSQKADNKSENFIEDLNLLMLKHGVSDIQFISFLFPLICD